MSHSIEIITRALTILAYKAGNVTETIKELKQEGTNVTPTTLTYWRDSSYADEYKGIRERFAAEYEAEAVRDMRDRMRQASEAERLAIQKVVDGLSDTTRVSAKDAAQTALNMSRVKKENVDKLLVMTGRPAQIVDDRSTKAALAALLAKKILKPSVSSGDRYGRDE